AVPRAAEARCLGCAPGAGGRPPEAPSGYVYYPAYGAPLPESRLLSRGSPEPLRSLICYLDRDEWNRLVPAVRPTGRPAWLPGGLCAWAVRSRAKAGDAHRATGTAPRVG